MNAKTSAPKIAFLICPIGEPDSPTNRRSRRLLQEIVRPTLARFGFETKDFLDPDYSEDQEGIRRRMRNWIDSVPVCIADLTENNPNVFFEYGLRRATGLPVIAFVQKGQKLLFDIDDYHTPPYDLEAPGPAIRAIEEFLSRKGLGRPSVQIAAERQTQTAYIADYIVRNKARSIDILHVSMVNKADPIIAAAGQCPDVTIRVILMHPDEAARYALGRDHKEDVLATERIIRRNLHIASTYQYMPPTLGLWYYRHEPSVAAIMVDDDLIQLGWYTREPVPGNLALVRLQGHNQPGILAEGPNARLLLPKMRDHFKAVWLSAEPGPTECFSGPRGSQLRSEWNSLRQR